MESVKTLIAQFISRIWNEQRFEELDQFLHSSFKDHSLPPGYPDGAQGLVQWIRNTSQSFTHQQAIEEQVSEGNKSMIKVRMYLTHIGPWRNLAPTGMDIEAIGYRFFQCQDGKIIGHWALIDGNAIEGQIKMAHHGCKVQR